MMKLLSDRKLWLIAHIITAASLLSSCSSTPPPKKSLDNICSIYYYDDDWYDASMKSYKRWGVPPWVQLAFVHQESTFKAKAKPPMEYFLGIPIGRPSSAYGYAQATDEAWFDYQKSTKRWSADRDDIEDALDFIGWYNHQSYKRLKIRKNDPYKLYLAYHEGHTGYRNRTYLKKKWLNKVALKVERRAKMYQKQFKSCR